MFNPSMYENSRPDGIGVLEIVGGVKQKEGEPRLFVPLKRTELRGEVTGPLGALHLTQAFGYSRAQCNQVLEAVYRFPLPGDAAVTGVRVRFGDVEIRAELKERGQAEADYAEAKKEGKQAALLTRESPNVFTLQVAGIQPDQEVWVETSYVQLARAEGNGWTLRVPLTTSPRYVRSDEVTSRPAHGQPLFLLRDPGHRFALDVILRGAGAAQSSTHKLDVTATDGGLRVRLQEGEVLPDRDCVLAWQPVQEEARPALHVLLHRDTASDQVYFLALVAPPSAHQPGTGVPREVILLVDHSGSMQGPKWQAADWATKQFLAGLTDQDAFDLGLFHNVTTWFAPAPGKADAGTVQAAIRFLEEHTDSGGTELGVALEQALDLARATGQRARHVLIATDAEVSDADRILRLADAEAKQAQRRRISVLCIDAAPNSFLASELAERGGGMARFLTSQPEEEDITTALDEILVDWAEPALTGLRLEVDRDGAQAAGRDLAPGPFPLREGGWTALDLGDLPAGRAVWVAGRVPQGQAGELTFRLAAASQPDVATVRADPAGAGEHPALKALFGARRVLGLEYLINAGYEDKVLRDQLKRLGYDPKAALEGQAAKKPKVYAENVRADASKALRDLLVSEALDYGLACSETAFVAVRTQAGKPVEGTIPVGNALPAGWSDQFAAGRSMGALAASPPGVFASAPLLRSAGLSLGSGTGMGMPSLPSFLRRPAPSAKAVFDKSLGHLAEAAPETAGASAVCFSGVPTFTGGEAVLFDSSRAQDAKKLPASATLSRLEVKLPGRAPAKGSLSPTLSLLIFVGDLASPRAKVRLADVLAQGGARPLNLSLSAGQVVRIVLVDPAGAWSKGAPIEVALGWS